jgi:hypothetical protein
MFLHPLLFNHRRSGVAVGAMVIGSHYFSNQAASHVILAFFAAAPAL